MTAPAKRRRHMDAAPYGGVVELLAEVLAGQPSLPGAACREHIKLFDAAADGDREAAQEAIEVCGQCPVVEDCRQWIARAYPTRPPPGVWAGRYQRINRPRKKKKP